MIGPNKIKAAIFISGSGTNLKSLYKFSLKKKSPIKIDLVISNNKDAKGLLFSKKKKIITKVFNFKRRIIVENRILKDLEQRKIKLICLAGFMKILSRNFIKKFKGKIINVHPSLLPKYKGLNTHQRVIDNNEKFSGCTIHFVTHKLDSGKIILQDRVKILKSDNPQTLAKKILILENKIYPKAIDLILSKI